VPQTAPARHADTGIELGFRIGYGIPAGTTDGSVALSNRFTGVVPIIFDLGYRLHRRVYLGAFFQYGIGFVNEGSGGLANICAQQGYHCSSSILRFGGDVRFHVMPGRKVNPWLGAGLGYEKMSFDAHIAVNELTPSQDVHATASGIEFLHLDAACDYRLAANLFIGPFISVSVARYLNEELTFPESGQRLPFVRSVDIPNSAIHEWIMLGLRASYLIVL
jgi:outer membrane protein